MAINLSYYHAACDVPENNCEVAVVIDVLRATTTISWALNNGAESIQVFSDLSLLKKAAMNWGSDKRLMLVREGEKKLMALILVTRQ